MVSEWFVKQEVEKKKKSRPRAMFTGADFDRLLNKVVTVEPHRDFERLHMGSIAELTEPAGMREKLISFWMPEPRTKDYGHSFYTGIGTLTGDLFADRLHKAGVLHCEDLTIPYEEFYLRLTDIGLSGRVDLIIDSKKFKAWGAKTPKELEDDYEIVWNGGEVKQTNTRNFDMWESAYMLPVNYRTQFSVYLRELSSGKYEIKTEDKGVFIILSRDNPKRIKVLDYKCEQDLVDQAFKNCKDFWKHVQDKTFPEVKDLEMPTKKWVNECIVKQKERTWPVLANLGNSA